jgi:transmembrane sensor
LKEKSEHIDLLIARYISGEASEAEKQELEQWMSNNESNKKYFDGIVFADSKAVTSHKIITVDVDRAWNTVHGKMRTPSENAFPKLSTQRKTIPLWVRYAAILLLITGLSFFFQNRIAQYRFNLSTFTHSTTDSVSSFALIDSSIITLNQHSTLVLAKGYGKNERRMALTGEAFFEVEPNLEKPFVVESGETFIKVTGTSFNVKNIESDSLVEVYVQSGSVLFFSENNEGITLLAGEVGVYNKNKGTFIKVLQADRNTTAYTNRVFVFYNTPLKELFRQITRVYGAEFVFVNPEVAFCIITVSFNDDELETIVSIVTETLNLSYSIIDGQYHISGEACSTE